MKIQSKDVTNQQAQNIAQALGEHVPYLDNQRNVRPATMAEVEAYCFGPLKKIWQDWERRKAIAAANIEVPPADV